MTYGLYDGSVHQARSALRSMRHIFEQGEKHDTDAKFLQARLHETMRDLAFQVYVATTFAERLVALLSGSEPEEPKSGFKSYAEIYSHIDHVIQRLDKAEKSVVEQREHELVPLTLASGATFNVPAFAYANGYAIPHINFHVITAYNILRKEGVPLQKRDYLQEFLKPYLPDY